MTARNPLIHGRTMWQLNPDHIGLLNALENARVAALYEMDKRREAEELADELRRALVRAGAGLDRLAILHPAARKDIAALVDAIWPGGETA